MSSEAAVSTSPPSGRARSLALACLLLLVSLAADARFFAGRDASFALIYLIPVTVATWRAGRAAGVVFCVLVTIGYTVIELAAPASHLPANLWNVGMLSGVLLSFCIVLGYLRAHNAAFPLGRRLGKHLVSGLTAAAGLALAGNLVQHHVLPGGQTSRPALSLFGAGSPNTRDLADVAALLDRAMRLSRSVLLGSRNVEARSCVQPALTGQVTDHVPGNAGDLDGGPGTKFYVLMGFERRPFTQASEELTWHQDRLRKLLQNQLVDNENCLSAARNLADATAALAQSLKDCDAWPRHLAAIPCAGKDTWLTHCLASLNQAVAARDLEEAQRWSAELAGACLSLEDLHRWLAFLTSNYLAALDFQAQCAPLFAEADARESSYDPSGDLSRFPAGLLTLNGGANFLEVERQAEQLFSVPPDALAAVNGRATPAALWLPPRNRALFGRIGTTLSPSNQRTWELAPRSPYEHSYLVNMLTRAEESGATEGLIASVARFDTLHPQASLAELMGVLMYRGHSFAGLEWADRYQPQLAAAAAQLSGSDAEAFQQACQLTNQFYRSPAAGYGLTLTLREAIERNRLDCIRATDMIGSIFRNAGRPRFGHVRWCAGTNGHAAAAYIGKADGCLKVLIADGLNPAPQPEIWPNAYFQGHAWPPELRNNPQPYCVELYVRGLDNYIWAEGYIVRGPNAGILTKAAVPYFPAHEQASSQKVYNGPYPN